MGIQIIVVRTVVQNILIFTRGLVGAEAGVPSIVFPTSFCVFIFKGRIINNSKNHITANNTNAAEIVIVFPSVLPLAQ